jgi:hypothetical protein
MSKRLLKAGDIERLEATSFAGAMQALAASAIQPPNLCEGQTLGQPGNTLCTIGIGVCCTGCSSCSACSSCSGCTVCSGCSGCSGATQAA